MSIMINLIIAITLIELSQRRKILWERHNIQLVRLLFLLYFRQWLILKPILIICLFLIMLVLKNFNPKLQEFNKI